MKATPEQEACDHTYTELSVAETRQRGMMHWGMCWHVYECSKCGYVIAQDSSG